MASQVKAVNGDSSSATTVCFLGCGTLATAILGGVLESLLSPEASESSLPASLQPNKFVACVRRPESAKRITQSLPEGNKYPVTVLQNDNVNGISQASVVILGCKPWMLSEVLNAPGVREALAGKLLISILAGVPVDQIETVLYGSPSTSLETITSEKRCRVVRVMPNTAAIVRESMTVIGASNPPLSDEQTSLISWIFSAVGQITTLPPAQIDVVTSLCGSGPAFLALVLEGMADGALAMGLPRKEAQFMAAQTMKGTAAMVLNGDHPAMIREKVSTPGGCTIGGLLVLEEAGVRGSIARSVREATVVASMLGSGAKGVNGTRH